jgi:hypothetical protein
MNHTYHNSPGSIIFYPNMLNKWLNRNSYKAQGAYKQRQLIGNYYHESLYKLAGFDFSKVSSHWELLNLDEPRPLADTSICFDLWSIRN